MIINIKEDRLQQIKDELEIALKQLDQNGIEGALAYEGEARMPRTHYIEPYIIKVKVWVKDKKIVYVQDNGTLPDDPSEEHAHNKGYFERSKGILVHYKGKSVAEVIKASTLQEINIVSVSSATVSSNLFHVAILNALEKYKFEPETSKKPETPKESETSKEPENSRQPERHSYSRNGSGGGRKRAVNPEISK